MRFLRYLAVALLVVPGNVALAQFAGALGVGSGIGQIGSAGWARESRLNPSFRLEYPLASLLLRCQLILRPTRFPHRR